VTRRRLFIAATILAAGAATAAAVFFRVAESKRPRTTLAAPRIPPVTPKRPRPQVTEISRLIKLGWPVYCGGRHGNMVALTFDDGPGPLTPLALQVLRRAHVGASFFLVGRNVAARSRLPRSEAQLGDVGDHTWNHVQLSRLHPQMMYAELARTQAAVQAATHRRVVFFRPPYGARNGAVDAMSRRLGMIEVLWSVDSRDWTGASWSSIADVVAHAARPGSIVLMHENRGQTIRALRFLLLPALARRHLRPVSLTTLLTRNPPTQRQLRLGWSGCLGTRGG
jgi:peptidoglycan/xylan/chitin deacetylase (PgdA/CDA1 family)